MRGKFLPQRRQRRQRVIFLDQRADFWDRLIGYLCAVLFVFIVALLAYLKFSGA